MRGRLLVVNPAGLSRYEGLYEGLEALGWQTTVADVEAPALLNAYARMRSFRPSVAQWRGNLQRVSNQLYRTRLAFEYQSRRYGRKLERQVAQHDVVLQTGAMFAHFWPRPRAPYAIFCDCTVKLGESEPLSGVDFPSPEAARQWYEVEGYLYRNAGYVFPTSQLTRRSLIEDYGVAAERAVAVGSAANLRMAEDGTAARDGRIVLYVGYDFERKGGPVLLEAFRTVVAELPDAQLWIAGPRELDHPLPPGAKLLGALAPAALSRAYAEASLFVMPSLFEPFGIAFLEAMDHGLPCVGSDRGCMSEVITPGETGLLAAAGDPEALARQILTLLRNPDLMREMGARGRERVRRDFTWPAVARRLDERLVELVAPASGGTRRPEMSWLDALIPA